MQRRKLCQAKICILQFRALLVGANISGQHQEVRARGWLRHKIGLRFQMHIGQQLQFHAAAPCPSAILVAARMASL